MAFWDVSAPSENQESQVDLMCGSNELDLDGGGKQVHLM